MNLEKASKSPATPERAKNTLIQEVNSEQLLQASTSPAATLRARVFCLCKTTVHINSCKSALILQVGPDPTRLHPYLDAIAYHPSTGGLEVNEGDCAAPPRAALMALKKKNVLKGQPRPIRHYCVARDYLGGGVANSGLLRAGVLASERKATGRNWENHAENLDHRP